MSRHCLSPDSRSNGGTHQESGGMGTADENQYEEARRQRIEANQQKLRALGLGCPASAAPAAAEGCSFRAWGQPCKRARPAVKVLPHLLHTSRRCQRPKRQLTVQRGNLAAAHRADA